MAGSKDDVPTENGKTRVPPPFLQVIECEGRNERVRLLWRHIWWRGRMYPMCRCGGGGCDDSDECGVVVKLGSKTGRDMEQD
eukprot:4939978-Ditylum_brightwellii.AAC.1